jgi:flavodoxin I
LVLDQRGQAHLTDERLHSWLAQVTPLLLAKQAEAA